MNENPLEAIRQYIDELATAYWDDVYQYALGLTKRSEDAEDLTQEVFEQTHFYLRDHPDVRIRNPLGWFHKAVRFRYLNSKRGKLKQSTDSLDQIQALRSTGDDMQQIELPGRREDEPEQALECSEREKETKDSIRKAIAGAPFEERVKEELVLSVIEGYNDQEIAYERHVPPAAIKKRRETGIRELRAHWKYPVE